MLLAFVHPRLGVCLGLGGGTPKRFTVPVSPGTPWGHGDSSAGGKPGLAPHPPAEPGLKKPLPAPPRPPLPSKIHLC